jgi:hypothetical protein
VAQEERQNSEEKQKPEHPRSAVYEWENQIAIVGYSGSPSPDTPWEIEKGSPEARAGMFVLTEVSDLGIMVNKLIIRGKSDEARVYLDDPIFLPWASIHSIRLLSSPNESSGSDKSSEE